VGTGFLIFERLIPHYRRKIFCGDFLPNLEGIILNRNRRPICLVQLLIAAILASQNVLLIMYLNINLK
jgi:hypothetical protein